MSQSLSSYVLFVATHPYGQLGGDVSRASSRVLWVKVGAGAAQEAGFEDVSTAAIGKEATLVQVHLFPRCLEVQGHCRRVESVKHDNKQRHKHASRSRHHCVVITQ